MRTYVLSSSTVKKIESSGLIDKYLEFGNRFYGPHFHSEDIYENLLENPFKLSDEVRKRLLSVVEKNTFDDSISLRGNWILGTGKILKRKHLYRETQLDLFNKESIPEFSLYGNMNFIDIDTTDFALASGCYLPENFSPDTLHDYKKYGFRSIIEFLMTFSAYRVRNTLSMKNNEYQWVNSKGIKNIITACTHGDPKFYQYDEGKKFVLSPYFERVGFYPRQCIGSMTHVYHHMEDAFFGTFFGYVIDSGKEKEVFGKKGQKILKYIDTLPNRGGNFGDAGYSYGMEEFDFKNRVTQKVCRIEDFPNQLNIHTFSWAPGADRENTWYTAYTNKDGVFELKITTDKGKKIGDTVLKYYPEDCQDMIKGLLWQCAHGHGRTSVKTLKRLIEYYYSDEFDKI